MPQKVKDIVHPLMTLSQTGNTRYYQGWDACLEEVNKGLKVKKKKVCKDQELRHSEPNSSPKNQNGKYLLQIVKIQR